MRYSCIRILPAIGNFVLAYMRVSPAIDKPCSRFLPFVNKILTDRTGDQR